MNITHPQHRRLLCGLLLATTALGCSTSDDTDAQPDAAVHRAQIDAYAVAGTQLAILDAADDALLRYELDTPANTVRAKRVALPPNPVTLTTRTGEHAEWLVRCAGLRGVDEPMQLVAMDLRGKLRSYALSAPYTSMEQTRDGRFAVLRFEQGARSTAFPPAQVAVVDLTSKAKPHETTVQLGGAAPDAWRLAPPMAIGDGTRHFALASGAQQVALLDLEAPEVEPLRVTLSGDPALAKHVTAAAFDAERGRIALLSEDLDDVVLLELRADASAKRGYTLDVANLAAGRGPSALTFTRDGSLVVLTNDGTTLLTLAAQTGARNEHALQARAQALAACTDCAYALLYAALSREATLVKLDDAVAGEADALKSLQLAEPVTQFIQSGDTGHVGCLHDAGALTWFDLYDGSVFPLGISAADARAATAADDGALWFAPEGSPLLAHYDAERGALTEVLLRAPVAGFALVPKAGVAVVLHESKSIGFTLVPDTEPSFEAARYVWSLPE